MDDNPRGRIGNNNPPGPTLDEPDPTKLGDVALIAPRLRVRFAHLEARREELLSGIKNWIAAHTAEDATRPVIEDDDDCGDALDYLKQLREFGTREVETARKEVKEPFDRAGKAIQAWFAQGLAQKVKDATTPIETAYSQFLINKNNDIRAGKQREAAAATEEAKRLAEQARRARAPEQQDSLLAQAVEAENLASDLLAAADAPAKDITRVHGYAGSVGGLKTTWHWRIENLMDLVQAVVAGRETIEMLDTNEAHINSLVRPQDPAGRRKIPGITIYSEQKGR